MINTQMYLGYKKKKIAFRSILCVKGKNRDKKYTLIIMKGKKRGEEIDATVLTSFAENKEKK